MRKALHARVETMQKFSLLSSVIENIEKVWKNESMTEVQRWIASTRESIQSLENVHSNVKYIDDGSERPPEDDPSPMLPPSDLKLRCRMHVVAVFVVTHHIATQTEATVADMINEHAGEFLFMQPGHSMHKYYEQCKASVRAGHLNMAVCVCIAFSPCARCCSRSLGSAAALSAERCSDTQAGVTKNDEADRVFSELATSATARDKPTDAEGMTVTLADYIRWYRAYLTSEGRDTTVVSHQRDRILAAKRLFVSYDRGYQTSAKAGCLDKYQFRGFFNGVCARGDVLLDHNATMEIFRKIDADGDGAVQFEEFWKWASHKASASLHSHADVDCCHLPLHLVAAVRFDTVLARRTALRLMPLTR